MTQLGAILKKNYLEKKRSPCTTLCECCSHLIIIILLMLGYSLSVSLSNPAAQYDVIKVTIPPTFIDQSMPLTKSANKVKPTEAFTAYKDFIKGPLVVPSFDQYVTVARYISNHFGGSNTVQLLNSVAFQGAYGNLLRFGSIHLAPYPSPLVDSYIAYMEANTKTFHGIKRHTHTSENAAVHYILKNPSQPAFALLVFRDITANHINYVIRQNYSTLPSTKTLILNHPLGLDTHYQVSLYNAYYTHIIYEVYSIYYTCILYKYCILFTYYI